MDNSYSNSNNGGSVNSQDSLWQVKGHGDPQMGSHMVQDPRSYQYDPMIHGGYGISGYDDYSHYPPASHQGQGMMEDYPGSRGNYMANGDPYAAVQKPRKRADHMGTSHVLLLSCMGGFIHGLDVISDGLQCLVFTIFSFLIYRWKL